MFVTNKNRVPCFMSVFRNRGVEVLIDTTKPAEFDIAGYQIPKGMIERIGKRLQAMPFSPQDLEIQGLRARYLDGFWVLFIVGREHGDLVVIIGGIEPGKPTEPEENSALGLKIVEKIATLRGAAGI